MHLTIRRFAVRPVQLGAFWRRACGLLLLPLLFTLAGCLPGEERVPSLISVRSGAGQTALPGTPCEESRHRNSRAPAPFAFGRAESAATAADVRGAIEPTMPIVAQRPNRPLVRRIRAAFPGDLAPGSCAG